jgi:hypothetical protein
MRRISESLSWQHGQLQRTVFRMVLSFMPQRNERVHACGA